RLALTPQNFCFLACLSKRFYHLPVSNSANTLSRFTTASPQTLSFGKTFCLHSIIGLLRNFCRQIGTTNTHIFRSQAKRSCIRTQLIAHFTHHVATLFRQSCFKTALTVNTTQSSIKTRTQTLFCKKRATRYSLSEFTRIGNAINEESIYIVEFTTRNLNANIIKIKTQQTIINHLHRIGFKKAKWQFEIDAWFSFHINDLTKAQDDCWLAFIDHEDR